MKLVHHSPHRIIGIHDRDQSKRRFDKPTGLWVSDEHDYSWAEWCANNSPGFLGEYKYEIALSENANILYLKTPEDIDSFSLLYRGKDQIYNQLFAENGYIINIDWVAVAQKYDGIIITPYQWSRRLELSTRWYYGWDCASGCIWAKKAIKSFTLVV